MVLHRHFHNTTYWGTVFTEWPRPPSISLRQGTSIPIGWILTLQGEEAGERDGAGVFWEIALCLGFMALPDETPEGERHGVACVILQPLLGPALDHARLSEAYQRWYEAKLEAWARQNAGPTADAFTHLDELLLVPPAGPSHRAEPLDEARAWKTVAEAWGQVEDFQRAAEASDEPHRSSVQLLQDHPYLLAYQETPQRLWEPQAHLVKPTMDSGIDRVQIFQAPTDDGRPRSFETKNLSMAITEALVDSVGRQMRAEKPGPDGVKTDMRALFALELVLNTSDDRYRRARDRVHRWLLGGNERAATPADLRRRSKALRKKMKNTEDFARGGRRNTPVGAREVRKIVPTLIFDRSVFLKPNGDDGCDPLADTDATLVDWLRSPRVEELMAIVTGHRRDQLDMACIPGGFDDFMRLRGLPFHRVRVRFEPQDEGYRAAVGMLPGTQPGEAVEVDLTGFAEDPDDLLWRWFGSPLGEVRSVHTVPAGQPWPPLDSSMTSPPPSFGT